MAGLLAASIDAEAGTISLYVGGLLGAVVPIASAIVPGSPPLYMGQWTGDGRLFAGDLDAVLVYRRALFPAEVDELSRSSPPAPH
jgi:hypothetical protein